MTSTPLAGADRASLNELALRRGIQLSYTGQDGQQVRASIETLQALLGALGHDAATADEVRESLAAANAESEQRILDPVVVCGAKGQLSGRLRIGSETDTESCKVQIRREDGGLDVIPLSDLVRGAHSEPDGRVELELHIGEHRPPVGYHELAIVGLPRPVEALLLVPPRPERVSPGLGVIAPLYALRGDRDWGVGSYTDLATFASAVARWGGDLAGTLPLYASFFRDPVDPSPYLPVSRRYWNELYVDIDALPELHRSSEAQELTASTAVRAELDRLAAQPNADHGAVMALKRQVLAICAETFEQAGSERRSAFDAFAARKGDLSSYADFRAFDEKQPDWHSWDVTAQQLPAIADPAAARYHRYVQFVADEQLAAAAVRRDGRAGLYLDLPVGIHPDGYDVWAAPELFAAAGVGAPPDPFFSAGQSWGFPPLHPERIREDRYRYLIASLRTVMRYAAAIRIDHVLALHRLYWIPEGGAASDGGYVRYHDNELRAIVMIEAFRAGTIVVGEDLGTVSPEIRRGMDADGMLHTFVYQFDASPQEPLPQPTAPSAASVGSHDLPRFATWWRGGDIGELRDRGEITDREADTRWQIRRTIVDAVRHSAPVVVGSDADVMGGLTRCLQSLAIGPASYLFVDLADLELETVPDNRPGTGPESGNWRHRLRRPIADIAADPQVAGVMAQVAASRERAKAKGAAA